MSFAYFDEPELVHRINQDLLDFNLRLLDQIQQACVPTFMTIAEDMSYNHGPMISQQIFEEFLAPYYRKLVARARELNLLTIVDTDGDVTCWCRGCKGWEWTAYCRLERQAGVDGNRLRQLYPDLRMVGHYNKLVMHKGEAAIRAEFERLVPLIKSGGFIPSVDHQTPPGVSLEEYRLYVRLLKEYRARERIRDRAEDRAEGECAKLISNF